MKKLLSLLLAVLMLGSLTAYAETVTIADPTITVKAEDSEDTVLDLAGLSLVFGFDEETQTLACAVFGDGENLFNAAAKIDGNNVVMTADGLSNSYKVAIPAGEETEDVELPGGIDLDVDALTEALMNGLTIEENDDGSVAFTLSYTAINDVLELVAPALESIPEIDVTGLAESIAQLKETDSGVQISGLFTEGEEDAAASVEFYVVENGEVAETPVASGELTLTMDDALNLALEIYADVESSGELTEVAYFTLEAAEDGSFSFEMNMMDEFSLAFSFDTNTGVALISVESEGTTFTATAVFSVDEDGEITAIPVGDADSAIDVAELTEEQTTALGEEVLAALEGVMTYLENAIDAAA